MDSTNTLPIEASESNGVLTIHLNPGAERSLRPSILAIPDGLAFSGKKTLLYGRAPLWMYANFAVRAAVNGAEEVSIRQEGAGDTLVWSGGPLLKADRGGAASTDCYKITPESPGTARLEFIKAPDEKSGKWTITDLLKTRLRFPVKTEGLIIGGSAANWMCAAAALAAYDAGINYILYDTPKEPSLISIGASEPGRTLPRLKRTESGCVIGIAGDPNSGKSVLRSWLEKVFKDEWQNSWWIDADPASPTPNWYLDGLHSQRAAEVTKTRDTGKKDWTHELELMAAGNIRNARGNLNITLVDLPGGIHKKDAPAQRMPLGREVIFNEIDLFIILWKDKDALEGWRSVLAEHHLENRIFAEIESLDHDGPSLETHREGTLVLGTARGLDRKNDSYSVKPAILRGAEELTRHIRSWRTAQYAKAAVAKAFLTGEGVRYGAAVLCADGKIYTAGQYSSFNHSTNVHAEQGALLQAAMGGSFAVRILALASTDGSAVPRPCGVCRQVMLEHVQRTGSMFDVAMVGADGRIELESVAALLPFSWESHKSRKNQEQSLRRREPRLLPKPEDVPLRTGDCVSWSGSKTEAVGIVWESAFQPDEMLVKMKYLKTPSGEWLKLPHSLTQPFDYMDALQKAGFARPAGFGPSACLLKPSDITGFAASGIEGKAKPPETFVEFLTEAKIDISRLRYTASRALGLEQEGSDFDILLETNAEDVLRFRKTARIWLESGRAAIPKESGTWRLFDKIFPGGARRIIDEERFFESLEFGGQKVSVIFTREDTSLIYDEEEWDPAGWHTLSGVITDAHDAPFKRARFSLTTDFKKPVTVVSYYKLANLVKPGDRLSLGGWLLNNKKNSAVQRLVQILPKYDPLVWFP